MRFQIPQFIETEVKLVGPLTLKQFLWVGLGVVIIYLTFLMTGGISFMFFMVSLPVATISACLAFVKVEGQPLINYVMHGLSYLLSPKRYVFRKSDDKINLPGNR